MQQTFEPEARPVESITIHPRQRQEYEFDEIKRLGDSIKRTRGLIHPVVLDPTDDSLIAGGRRIQAYLYLQENYPDEPRWKEIPFIYKDQIDELDRQVQELEENVARLDLQWWEKAAALAKIHELQQKIAESKGESWNMRKTAEIAGVSLGTVQQSMKLVEESKSTPNIKKEKTLVGALQKVETKKKIEERKKDLERKSAGKIRTFPAVIKVGDALDLMKKEPSDEYDCIVTNFPFGVEYGYSGKAEKVYDDDESYIVDLVRSVVKESHRVLKPDSWFFAFFDIRKATYSNPAFNFFTRTKQVLNAALDKGAITKDLWEETLKMGHESLGLSHWFEEAGYDYVRLMPIIWVKPNKTTGNIGDPRKGMVTAYEAAIVACKGDGVLLKQGKQDILVYDTLGAGDRDFSMQMPVPLCKEIISMLTLGKGKVLDPFAGVGSFGEGALENQCSFVGFGLNPERAATGNLRLQEHTYASQEVKDGE